MKPEPGSVPPLDHGCKQTCSGWQQGYEKGLRQANSEMVAAQRSFAANVLIPNEEYAAQCKRVARLEEALRFYADSKNHLDEIMGAGVGRDHYGYRARLALKESP